MSCVAPRCGNPADGGKLLCSEHQAAPAAQRGGWLSADRRRKLRANGDASELDASNIARRLWVGAKPPFDRHLPQFDMLVLCAEELQPKVVSFQGRVLRVPLPDSSLTQDQTNRALMGGRLVAEALARKETVLVTCAKGINRSALVASLGLGLVTRLSADQLVAVVRTRRRPDCLFNPHFRAVLQRYIGQGRVPRSRG